MMYHLDWWWTWREVEWDIEDNEIILIIDWVILIDDICWCVPFWRNSVIYKHRLRIIIFISFDWCDRMMWRIDEINGKDMKSELSVSHSTHLCVVCSVWWNGCSSHCVSVSNRFTWTGVFPWPHVYEWCETPHCLWLWMRWSVWGECDDYWTSIPLTV